MEKLEFDRDLYQVLGVDKRASFDDIKKAYRLLALQLHPDKQAQNDESSDEKFKIVLKAWEILRDPESRKQYDVHVQANEIELDDMEYNDKDDSYKWICRCGDIMSIQQQDIDDNIHVFNCPSCSLHIRVLY